MQEFLSLNPYDCASIRQLYLKFHDPLSEPDYPISKSVVDPSTTPLALYVERSENGNPLYPSTLYAHVTPWACSPQEEWQPKRRGGKS